MTRCDIDILGFRDQTAATHLLRSRFGRTKQCATNPAAPRLWRDADVPQKGERRIAAQSRNIGGVDNDHGAADAPTIIVCGQEAGAIDRKSRIPSVGTVSSDRVVVLAKRWTDDTTRQRIRGTAGGRQADSLTYLKRSGNRSVFGERPTVLTADLN